MHRYLHNLDDFLLIDEECDADAGKILLHSPKWKQDPEEFVNADEDRKEFDYGDYENRFDRH